MGSAGSSAACRNGAQAALLLMANAIVWFAIAQGWP
jgi:hypothetical protein